MADYKLNSRRKIAALCEDASHTVVFIDSSLPADVKEDLLKEARAIARASGYARMNLTPSAENVEARFD